MLPVSVSDILKILDNVPVWRSLVSLPKRVADLEARVKALEEGKQSRAGPAANECPTCGARMVVTKEMNHPTFGMMGMKRHTMTCDGCGQTTTRDWNPKSGYS